MPYTIPMDFYPSPVKMTSGQRRRIRTLVHKQLAGEKVYNVIPQRGLIPLLIVMLLCIGISITAAIPQTREILSSAAAQLFGWEETSAETEPETETTQETETANDNAIVEIGSSLTVGDVRLTVTKALQDAASLYFQLRFDHLSGTFAGDILQFETMSLSDSKGELFSYHWGINGIYAGEVFALLDAQNPQDSVTVWLKVGTEKPEAGEYCLQIGQLFGCDTYAPSFDCTDYGNFELTFTLPVLPEVMTETRLEPDSAFRIGETEYTIESMVFTPMAVDVEISCGRDTVFLPDGYPALELTPIHRLGGLYSAALNAGLERMDANAVYVQEYELIPTFREGVSQDTVNSYSRFYAYQRTDPEIPQDTVAYHFVVQDLLSPEDLIRLELRKLDGSHTIVIWEPGK